MIARYLKRYLFILLLPVLRGLLNYGNSGVISTLILWELVLSVAIVAISVLRWKRYDICVYDGMMRISYGLFIKRIAMIPLSKICGVYVDRNPLTKLFGAVRVRIDTDAGRHKQPEFDFYFESKNISYLTLAVSPCHKGVRKYNCTVWQSFVLALSNASALTGLLVFATAVNYAGKIFDETTVNDTIKQTLTLFTAVLNRFIPPATAFLAFIIFIGFAISFFLTLFKYLRFSVRKSSDGIAVEQGVFWRKNSYINENEIAATVIKQPPLLRFFKRCSILIYTAGYGKNKSESNEIIPVEKKSEIDHSLMLIGLRQQSEKLTLKPANRAFSRVVFTPIVWALVFLALFAILMLRLPDYALAFLILLVFVELIIFYSISVRYKHHRDGGATLRNCVRVSGYQYVNLVDAQFEADKIDSVCLTQGPFDRMHGVCTLKVTTRSEAAYSLKSKNLDLIRTLTEIRDVYGL